MSNHWDALVEQLQDPDPGVRHKACRQMAATRDPKVLPYLYNAYRQEDDERVRQAAREGLAVFKAMQMGISSRSLPVSEPALRTALAGLAIVFVVLLVLNGLVRVLGGGGDDQPVATKPPQSSGPTDWNVLTAQLSQQLAYAQEDSANLRTEIAQHNNSGQVVCAITYRRPAQVILSELDRQTYRDLAIISDKLNLGLFQLQQPQMMWDRICRTQVAALPEGLEALKKLDEVNLTLAEVDRLLQQAIANPAPTFGPTVTPTPTTTFTPEPGTSTSLPPTATGTSLPTSTAPPTATATRTATPTATPLPYPALDYPQILRDISQRFVIMGDLTNAYQTGMRDRWQQAQQGAELSTTFCTLAEWPLGFELTPSQLEELQKPGVADPDLESAIALTNEGLDFAYQARALYEPSCQNGTLASTALQGITLAERALDRLTRAQTLVDTIRRRK